MIAASVLSAALLGRCPRCAEGPLFNGYLHVAPSCRSCRLDFAHFDVGDGASVFVILMAGFLVVGAALITEAVWSPPYWVHVVLWLPLITLLTLGGLRLVKATLMALQYKHDAREGRVAE